MPSYKHPTLIDKSHLQNYVSLLGGIPSRYSTDTYLGSCAEFQERYCASFLRDYVSGEVVLEDGLEDLMETLLIVSKKSRHSAIRSVLPKAYNKFKASLIYKRKQEEKKKTFIATRFNILENKKRAIKLCSDDMIMINDLLKKTTSYSTSKLQNKLRGFMSHKIDLTLKGEMVVDENFDKLVSAFGSYKQKNQFEHLLKKEGFKNFDEKMISVKKKNKRLKIKGLFKKVWRPVKRVAVVAGIALLGYVGIKTSQNSVKHEAKQNPVEMNTTPQKAISIQQDNLKNTIDFSQVQANLSSHHLKKEINKQESIKKEDRHNPNTVQKGDKKASAVGNKIPVQKKTQTSETLQEQSNTLSLEDAYKESHKASVMLHLGEKKAQKLYNALHTLEKDGKIEFGNGTNIEWYAYSYTMYKVIAPCSSETRLFEDFLQGMPVDKSVINDLVVKAGRNGTGVKGQGSYSAYDNASEQVQRDYIAKRNAIRKAQKTLKKHNTKINQMTFVANER